MQFKQPKLNINFPVYQNVTTKPCNWGFYTGKMKLAPRLIFLTNLFNDKGLKRESECQYQLAGEKALDLS